MRASALFTSLLTGVLLVGCIHEAEEPTAPVELEAVEPPVAEARVRGVEPTGKPKRSRRKKKSTPQTVKAKSTGRHVSPKAVRADSHHSPLTSTGMSSSAPVEVPRAEGGYVDRGAVLPRHYGRDTLVGMVRDPNWVYVYWELEGDRKNEIAREYGSEIFFGSRWVLRLHNLTSCVEEDVPVLIESGNWYLSVPDSSEFFVELGLLTADNTFIKLVSSNRFQTPRSDVCTDEDE
ncbi:MAG: DUF4912 domain-containing protein, partial [Thiohalospira sp.]